MAILAQDSFNRANTSNTMGNLETGQTWQSYVTQTWSILSNRACPVTPSYDNPMYVEVGQSDNVALQVNLTRTPNTSQVFWRIFNTNNMFLLQNNQVYVRVNGTKTLIGTLPVTIAIEDTFRVELVGSVHKLFINGVLQYTFTDSRFLTGTKFGFSASTAKTSRFDDFLVETLSVGDTTPPAEVTSLTETHTTNSVTLSWVNPTDPDFSHVRILRGGTEIATNLTGTTYTDTGRTSDTTYSYSLRTVDTTGNESAGVSISATTNKVVVPSVPPLVTEARLSKNKISDEVNMDRAILFFKFDQAVIEWSVNVMGVDPFTGRVADSGGIVSAGVEIQAEIDWTELYQEGENRINIYGKNATGAWTPYNSSIEEPPPLPSNVIIQDSFDRANNVTSLGNAVSGQPWKLYNPYAQTLTYGISNNRFYCSNFGADGSRQFAGFDVGVPDYKVTVTAPTIVSASNLLFRAKPVTAGGGVINALRVRFDKTVGYFVEHFQLSTKVTLASSSVIPVDGDVVSVICQGQSIKVIVNNVEIISLTSSINLTDTNVGLNCHDFTTNTFDNFQVETLDSTSTTEIIKTWVGRAE